MCTIIELYGYCINYYCYRMNVEYYFVCVCLMCVSRVCVSRVCVCVCVCTIVFYYLVKILYKLWIPLHVTVDNRDVEGTFSTSSSRITAPNNCISHNIIVHIFCNLFNLLKYLMYVNYLPIVISWYIDNIWWETYVSMRRSYNYGRGSRGGCGCN